jgi:hypothetical protein
MSLRVALSITVVALLVAAPAHAADPGRWRETGLTKLPLVYYQGVTHDPAGSWFFDGVFEGLWRTDRGFTQTGGNPSAFPPQVKATEQYNHIGDLTYDRAEGGRLILPVECYYPPQGNTCNTGSFGVADPSTLQWRYYVKLDPAEIPKAMWAEASPDGRYLWTSAGNDLLAYRTSDVTPANAAPLRPPIKAAIRLRGAVPPSGITGATFFRGRLFVAGSQGRRFQVWSIDLATGSRRFEIEREVVGESEGLDTFSAAGGVLHWLIQPFNTEGPPTYGADQATLLHFVPGAAPARTRARRGAARLRLRVKPRRVRAGRRVRFRFTVWRPGGRKVRGAVVTMAGFRARTNRRGHATLRVRLRSPGTYAVRASRRGLRPGRSTVRATGRVSTARAAAFRAPAG